MSVELLIEHHLEFRSLKGSCTGPSESTLVKMPHCWKSLVTAQMYLNDHDNQNLVNVTSSTAFPENLMQLSSIWTKVRLPQNIYEPVHEISNNVAWANSKASD